MYGLSKIEMGIVFLLLIYVLGDFKTPNQIMFSFRTPFAGLIIFGILIYLFYNAHIIITLMYVFAVYELLKRADIEEYEDEKESTEEFNKMKEDFDKMLEGFEDGDDIESDDIERLIASANNEGLETQETEESVVDNNDVADASQQVYALNGATETDTNESEMIETFTQMLGANSLENEMITNMAPVGLGTKIKYNTAAFNSSTTNVSGASLV